MNDRTGREADGGESAGQYEALLRKYEALLRDYRLLANSKAGRLTLWYWKKKDRLRTGLQAALARKRLRPIDNEADLPTVSVIVPTYRQNPYLEEAVRSALEQDYPAEKLTVLLAVNGTDLAYLQNLRETYRNEDRVKVLHTEKQSVGAARNLALAAAETECVCYLDDDDLLTPGYLRLLGAWMRPETTVVCGPLADRASESPELQTDTYVNRTIESVGPGAYHRYLPAAPLLSSLPAKLYRTGLLQREFTPQEEDLSNSEDVIFWAENFHAMRGLLCLCGTERGEYYVRRLTPGSLSRPLDRNKLRFYVQDRLTVLERLDAIRERAATEKERQFLRAKIERQREYLTDCLATLSEEEKAEAARMIARSTLKNKPEIPGFRQEDEEQT